MDARLIEDNYRIAKQNEADIIVFGFKTVWLDGDERTVKRTEINIPRLSGTFDCRALWGTF